MTAAEDLAVALVRLEGKVDQLAEKVRFGDSQSQQLVELLRQQVTHTGAAVDEVKKSIADLRAESADRGATLRHEVLEAISAVRVSLERQVSDVQVCVDELTVRVEQLELSEGRRRWRSDALKPVAALAWGTAGTAVGIAVTRLIT
jgi:hypothetical protein